MDYTASRTKHTRPANSAGVVPFTMLTGIIVGLFALGTVATIIYHPLWFALSAGSLASLLMLVWRINEHDQRRLSTREFRQETTEGDTMRIRPEVITNNGPGSKNVRLASFKLTYREWHKLATILLRNDGRFVRDTVAAAGVFKSITKKWREIESEFERLGMVQDKALTARGVTWFNKFVAPVAPPTPNGFDYSE